MSGFDFDPASISKELQDCLDLHKAHYSYIINGAADVEQSWEAFRKAAYDVIKKYR